MDTEVIPYSYPGDQVSSIYRVTINGVAVPVAETPGIAPEDYERIAAEYHEMPSYCWVEPRFVAVHHAYAACAGRAEVTVTVSRPIGEVVVHPKRRGIEPHVDGETIRFEVPPTEPRYLLVNIADLPLLAILIDPPEEDVPGPGQGIQVNLRQFLASEKDVAAAFQRAVEVVNGTGGTLVIPAGDYEADTLRLHDVSNCRIYLAPGALIRTRTSPPGENVHSHGLWIEGCHDLTITGRGCIDHQGFENFAGGTNDYKHGLVGWAVPSALNPYTTESPLFVHNSRDIVIEGLTVRNARNFNVNLHRSDRITLRRVKVITPPASVPEYTDGYQINSCRDTLLEDCFAFCNDDCIASGHYFYSHDDRASRNLVVRGFVGWNHRANGMRLGFYTHYDMGDMTFVNLDIAGPIGPGVLIHPLKDAPEADRYQRYGTVRFVNCGFDLTERMAHGLIFVDGARLDLLAFSNVTFDHASPGVSVIRGHGADGIQRLALHEVTIGGEAVKDLAAAGFRIEGVGELIVA